MTILDWINAPPPPATRAQCEDGARPCPALRCEFHLGRIGEREGYTCELDVCELPDEERTFDLIGRLCGVTGERAMHARDSACHKIASSDPETLRLLGVRRRHT